VAITTWNELGSRELGRKLGNVLGIVALFIKNMRLHFPLHVGEMDIQDLDTITCIWDGGINTIIYRQISS
jgi:hypothetical protein